MSVDTTTPVVSDNAGAVDAGDASGMQGDSHNDASHSHCIASKLSSEIQPSEQEEDDDVVDLGWNQSRYEISGEIVPNMPNDVFWMMMRRFNHQIYHVKAIEGDAPGGFDLNTADHEEFGSPDKLRTVVERLYVTVIAGVTGFIAHIARLRSWNEKPRTVAFLVAYFGSWTIDLLIPLILLTLTVLILYPPSRSFLFPPSSVTSTDKKPEVKLPSAGVFGSDKTAAGVPEDYKGEEIEHEARQFTSQITSIVLSSATGETKSGLSKTIANEMTDTKESVDNDKSSTGVATATDDIATDGKQGDPSESEPSENTDRTMEETIWSTIRPSVHILSDLADTWERFHNLLSPPPPFPSQVARLRLASIIAVTSIAAIFATPYLMFKGFTFVFGFLFFGNPIISRTLDWMNRHYPHWTYYLQLRNNILHGVPTNAQIALTLIRSGELAKAPLPPQPKKAAQQPDDSDENAKAQHSDEVESETDKNDDQTEPGSKRKAFLSTFRKATKASIKTVLALDHASAKVGVSSKAKDRLGIIPYSDEKVTSGPLRFKGRHDGKKGYVLISTPGNIPELSFTTESGMRDSKVLLKLPVSRIKEMRKIGGLGWKSEMVVNWALQSDVRNGLEIIDNDNNKIVITALESRDELFNRLLGIGGQKWEVW